MRDSLPEKYHCECTHKSGGVEIYGMYLIDQYFIKNAQYFLFSKM
jgi:hypothetical protein